MIDETQQTKGIVLDSIREKRRKLADEHTTDLPVAGYGGELVVRYKLLDPLVEGKQIGDRVSAQFKDDEAGRMYYSFVDTLIVACVGVYAKVDGRLVPLNGDDTLAPTFEDTDELAELLAFDPQLTARETVYQLFGRNRVALEMHAQQLTAWMADPAGELNRGILG